MKQCIRLTKDEMDALLKFPGYISLLAAKSDGLLGKAENNEAFKLEHIKTFSANSLPKEFYKEADKVFKISWNRLIKIYQKKQNTAKLPSKMN